MLVQLLGLKEDIMPKNEYICDCNVVHKEAVDEALLRMPTDSVIEGVSSFFRIMGDPTRSRIICALLSGEMCVCDLANVLSMSKSSISHQLAKMRESGVVKCRREGKEVYYSLDDNHVSEIFETTITHINHRR
jgi:ArsR family transcriptional regulator